MSRASAGITIAEDALDFGEAWLQGSFEWTLPFHNPTDESTEVVELKTSCNCVRTQPPRFVLSPKDTLRVRITLDLTERGDDIGAVPVRAFSTQLVAIVKGESFLQVGWRLRGRIRSAIHISSSVIDFGDGLMLGGPFEPRSLGVKCHTPMRQLVAECDPDSASAVLVPRVGYDTGSSEPSDAPLQYELRVTPSSTLSEGLFDFVVRLKGKTAEGEAFAPIPVRVTGKVVSDICSLPPSLAFGRLAVGDVVEDTVELVSRSGHAFAVTNVITGRNVLKVQPTSSPLAARHVFEVKYQGADAGWHESRLAFETRDEEGHSRVADVPISSYVTSDVQILPLAHDAPRTPTSATNEEGEDR